MTELQSIPVRVETATDGALRTDNLKPLLREIEQALRDLIHTGSEVVIVLTAMPFSENDEQDLRALLGHGEVTATVDTFGPTLVEETRYPGVWLVEHQDAERRRLTLHLEVARIPRLLTTPEDDLADSLAALRRANTRSLDTPTEDVR